MVVMVTGLAALLLLGIWVTDSGDDTSDLRPLNGVTLADVLPRVQQAISRDGMVFHLTDVSRVEVRGPLLQRSESESKTEYWIDAAGERARVEYGNRRTVVYAGGRYYYVPTDDQFSVPESFPVCQSAAEVSALLVGYFYSYCLQNTEILSGEYGGKSVIAVKNSSVHKDSDTDISTTSTGWSYLDSTTYLPLGTSGESRGLGSAEYSSTVTIEFLPLASLSGDFFTSVIADYTARCAEIRVQRREPCYLVITPQKGNSGSLNNPQFIIDEAIRLGTRPSTDIAYRSSATATKITRGEAFNRIAVKGHGQPFFEHSMIESFGNPSDEEVWFVEAPGLFQLRMIGGPGPGPVPTLPLLRGTFLAVIAVDSGEIVYSDVAYD